MTYPKEFFHRNTPYLALPDNPTATLNRGMEFLCAHREKDPNGYDQAFKGTPFYWLGTAAFLAHDYQTAVFFYDAAVSEDILGGSDPSNSESPALKFLYMTGSDQAQAAKELVEQTQAEIENGIIRYNARPGRRDGRADLCMDDIREHFIKYVLSPQNNKYRSIATAFLSFFLERKHRLRMLDLGARQCTVEPFFLHLFKGCLLFESLIKASPQKYRGDTLEKLLGDKLVKGKLGIDRSMSTSTKQFMNVQKSLPSRSIVTDMELVSQMRNTLGHSLSREVDFNRENYNSLVECAASSCLHIIACLYR